MVIIILKINRGYIAVCIINHEHIIIRNKSINKRNYKLKGVFSNGQTKKIIFKLTVVVAALAMDPCISCAVELLSADWRTCTFRSFVVKLLPFWPSLY